MPSWVLPPTVLDGLPKGTTNARAMHADGWAWVLVAREVGAPAVPIKEAVKPDVVTCLECGLHFKLLKSHLQRHHGMSVEDYRQRWKLGPEVPMVAPNYAEARRKLWEKLQSGKSN